MPEKNRTDLEKIKELVELMKQNDLVELEIVDGENRILLKRPGLGQSVVTQIPVTAAQPPAAEFITPQVQEAKTPSAQQQEEGLVEIKSPIVGTFYSAASPDSEPFVTIDSRVEPETIVCIVEAMKVMNEIKAETSGTIAEIMCKPGQAVEYGQVLFKVRPD